MLKCKNSFPGDRLVPPKGPQVVPEPPFFYLTSRLAGPDTLPMQDTLVCCD